MEVHQMDGGAGGHGSAGSKGKYRTRSVTCGRKDRISNLPADVIDSILERVPFKDAVRTSIISKNWRYRWTTVKAMVFDDEFNKKFAKNGAFDRNGFISTINQVLNLHKGPISKFVVYLPNMFLDSFQDIDQWMLYLSRNGVTKLVLTNSNRRYELPSYLFSCLGLTQLILNNCFFKPPLQFEGFLNLEVLLFDHIDFGANLCSTQISLPQLQNLTMRDCTNVFNFNIKATKLKTLMIINCPDAKLLQLLENPSLTTFGISFKNMEDFVQVERINTVNLLRSLIRIEDFLIEGNFLEFLFAEEVPKWLPQSVDSLKCLVLQDFQLDYLNQLNGALCLLRNSPNLETLRVCMDVDMESQVEVEPVLNCLEDPNCLECTLKQLRTVEITYIAGSTCQLLFIKLLLAHSPCLEKMTITPVGLLNVLERYDIAKDVMRFSRASPKAELIFLDPERY